MDTWDLRTSGGAAGIEFARARIDHQQAVIVHAPPSSIDVEVRDEDGRSIATGEGLKAGDDTPMARLRIQAGDVVREDIWPGDGDIGTVVILSGGEAGKLTAWWNDDDRSEWRWSIELYNRREAADQ